MPTKNRRAGESREVSPGHSKQNVLEFPQWPKTLLVKQLTTRAKTINESPIECVTQFADRYTNCRIGALRFTAATITIISTTKNNNSHALSFFSFFLLLLLLRDTHSFLL
eukprot:GHVU01130158.1.p1 GENE.GHVU01130158.1~~GHVU01130158.1.p1  ORF type:complete len:110 (-),score=6.78 GHVU01130158.1:359-688(-)